VTTDFEEAAVIKRNTRTSICVESISVLLPKRAHPLQDRRVEHGVVGRHTTVTSSEKPKMRGVTIEPL
jgi:hypothetical protein